MIASAVSTVATTTPLFGTQTLILSRFAVVIAITMLVGLFFTFFFLAPLTALFGPDRGSHTASDPNASFSKRTLAILYSSKAVRFIVVCLGILLVLVRPFAHLNTRG